MRVVEVDGTGCYSSTDIGSKIGISRQTSWRGTRDGRSPIGPRFRGRLILFSATEVEPIRD
jgi:hypothetical protein